jgi:anti-anti-sigma factor
LTESSSPNRGSSRAEQIVKLGQLSMRSGREGDTHTVAMSGEMDIANAGDVERELVRVEAGDAPAIVLDLGGLTFIDSTGIRMLLMADARSRADGDRLVLRRPSQAVLRVLHLAGIEDRLHFSE